MNPSLPTYDQVMRSTRRHFLGQSGLGLGAMAMGHLLGTPAHASPGVLAAPHLAPKAKRVIYLFQAGGPSHLETFDYKPVLRQGHGKAPLVEHGALAGLLSLRIARCETGHRR